jgi:ankyrin repeat protein
MAVASALDAIRKNDQDALTAALDAGLDPNARDGDGWTLLMQAVYWNRLHMVNLLLSRGADVHHKDRFDQTALHVVTWWHSEVLFRMLFSATGPCTMNFTNCDGWTPLHYLAVNGSAEQMAFALSHPGIDVFIRNDEGRTPSDVWPDKRTALHSYADQEARWQPLRYTWIKFLMIPMRL